MVTVPDIYFLPEWAKYFETKEENGELQLFEVKSELGHIYYQFIKRQIIINNIKTSYFDTITPYGFNGPVILESKEDKRAELVALFDKKFQQFCEKENIVTEYIRFNPWLENHRDFEQIYKLRNHGPTSHIDIEGDDFFMEEFSSNARRQVRRARKNNVEIEFDFTGFSTKEFNRLYALMAKKNNVDDYYMFTDEFLLNSFEALAGKQFIVSAKHEGRYISAVFVVHHGEYLHYHLAASDPEYLHLAGNSLVIYEICRWGNENGKKKLQLGGSADDKNLLRFKKGFSKTEDIDLMIGMRNRIPRAYDELVALKNSVAEIKNYDYFPLYRG